jgi:hypothetical protein
MPPSISVLLQLLPNESVSLGRLVLNIKAPWQSFCPSSIIELSREEIALKSIFSIKDIADQSKGTQFNVRLMEFFSSLVKMDGSKWSDITASQATSYLLLNTDSHFETMCNDGRTRAWLQNVIKRGRTAYMVVGIHTIKDGTVVHHSRRQIESGLSVQAPPHVSAGQNVAIDISSSRDSRMKSSLTAPDEYVIAIQYRKICFKWYASRKLESGFLEQGNRWRIYVLRGSEDSQEFEDVVEACLSDQSPDEVPKGELELLDLVTEGGNTIFLV